MVGQRTLNPFILVRIQVPEQMQTFFEIFLIIILILLNGYFSLSEIALLSAKKSRLRRMAKSGDKKAEAALALIRNSSEMLSAVQIGITSIGIFAGAFSGATVSRYVEAFLITIPLLTPIAHGLSVVIVVLVITYFSLIIGELVPKQIALSHPEHRALAVARPIRLFMRATTPLVKFLSMSTHAVLRLLGIKLTPEQVISEEEIKLLIAEGTETGVFEKTEQKMVERIFHLGNLPIKAFMTPREQIVWIDVKDTVEIIRQKTVGSDRSVFPVCDGNVDTYLGAIEIKDVFAHVLSGTIGEIDLPKLIQPVLQIDIEMPSLVAIERLKRSHISIALVTEKNTKKIAGIISFHDILEAIVGEFKSA